MPKKVVITLVLAGLGLCLVAGVTGAWVLFGANTPAFEGERGVKIPPDASFAVALDSLEANGVVRSRSTLAWVGRLTGWGDQVKAGYYAFEEGASNYDLLDTIRKGLQTPVRVTIPPGSTPDVVAAVAGREMAFEAADFEAALRDSALAARLGTDTAHLFGYMLPETYFFYWLTDAAEVVAKVKESFDAFYAEAAPDGLDLSKEEVVTVASFVEWETAVVEEKPRVAGVYLNRLRRPGWRLEADPTVQYAILESEGQKRRLFNRDYNIEHPYNTYLIDGLPPGPVTNPSPSSVESVLRAEDHDYMFFVATGEGDHTFSRTLDEHINAARRYHRLMRERRRAAQRAASDAG